MGGLPFHENEIYNDAEEKVAYVKENEVFSMDGEKMGEVKRAAIAGEQCLHYSRNSLIVKDKVVGSGSGSGVNIVALGTIALLGRELLQKTD